MSRFSNAKILKMMGYKNISYASNGEQALQKIKESTEGFDFILLDWNMPVLTGIEFLKTLRTFKDKGICVETKVIMITAESSVPKVLEAMSNGAHEFIVKPVSLKVLSKKINGLIEQTAKEA